MRKEDINPKKTVYKTCNNYCSFTSLVQEVEDFAELCGCKLSDIQFEVEAYSHGYDDTNVEVRIYTEVDKTPEEIEKEYVGELVRIKKEEQRQKEMYKALKEKYEGASDA